MSKAAGKSNKSALIRDYLAAKPQASVGDIISKFQERGIKVSAALAAKIKYNPAEKRMRQRKARSAINGQRRRGRPPKRRLEQGGKADAIRQAFASLGRKTRPSEVVTHLGSRGITVSSSQVVSVRSALRKRRARKAAGRKGAARSPAAINDSVSLKGLIGAKKLAEKLGGIDVAQQAMSALSKLKPD
ncbi:MAG: hypothetical protein WD278_07370 [Pirellulales bacterium]